MCAREYCTPVDVLMPTALKACGLEPTVLRWWCVLWRRRYHGWQYSADTGRLLKITDAFGFPDVDKAALSLVRLPCTERFGFAWVQLQSGGGGDTDVDEDGAPLVDVDAFLGPDLVADFTALGLERLVRRRWQDSSHPRCTVEARTCTG